MGSVALGSPAAPTEMRVFGGVAQGNAKPLCWSRCEKPLAEALAMRETAVRKWLEVGHYPVFVVKGCLPPGAGEPTTDALADDNLVALRGIATIQKAMTVGGCSGDSVFVIVRLPGEHPASVACVRWQALVCTRLARPRRWSHTRLPRVVRVDLDMQAPTARLLPLVLAPQQPRLVSGTLAGRWW